MKRILLISLMLLVFVSSAYAEFRMGKVSPKGKKYTLVLMTPVEFNSLVYKRMDDKMKWEYNTGKVVVLGITITQRHRGGFHTWTTKTVYIPMHNDMTYDKAVEEHEVSNHVDQEMRHPLNGGKW